MNEELNVGEWPNREIGGRNNNIYFIFEMRYGG